MATKAREIRLADFFEESLAAVNRVIEIQSKDDKKLNPRITVGFVLEGGDKISLPGGEEVELKIKFLKTGKPLSRDSVAELGDRVQSDYRRYGIEFAKSLGQDFGRTMDTLFELSSEQRDAVYEIGRESSDSSEAVSRMLIAAFSIDAEDFRFDLDIPPLPKPQNQKKSVEYGFEFGVSQDFTKDRPTVSAKFTIKW